ncbi:MAG TPA: HAD hydrolase family protein [Candidatus Binatia bacterium]|nr:HAD hydrolase family protein [Candidatus Binatia bacterium]
MPERSLIAKLKKVRLFVCDVDGVLTNGTVLMGDGKEYKSFNIQDGLGLLLLMRSGIKVGWVSNRPSPVTQQRAEELGITYLIQSKGSKVESIDALLAKEGFDWADVCYVGDDVVDLGPLKRAGVSAAVANAIDEAKKIADYVTRASGGNGAVRELVRLVLSAQGKWKDVIKHFSA